MELSLMERFGIIEVSSRIILGKCPKLKKLAKKIRAKASHGQPEATEANVIDPKAKQDYYDKLSNLIEKDDIVLIHSSMDGLESIGITAEDFIAYMKKQVEEKQVTFVLPCFPITNLKLPTPKSRPYNQKKTLCWTGMLPNTFIGDADVVRTAFPYNSLAAMGPKASEMMEGNLDSEYVYGDTSAWRYCLNNNAKILFLGVKASCSNTMAIHMTPDVMGEDWPVKDWYEKRTYKVALEDGVIEKDILVQQDHWYQYCMEERTSGRLKESGILTEESIHGCNLGYVLDSLKMMVIMIEFVKQGKLSYMVPKRYWKK